MNMVGLLHFVAAPLYFCRGWIEGENMKNTTKRLKARNIELAKKVDELQQYIDNEIDLNKEQREEVNQLMNALRDLQDEWLDTINELNDIKERYRSLVKDLQSVRRSLYLDELKLKISLKDKIKLFFAK